MSGITGIVIGSLGVAVYALARLYALERRLYAELLATAKRRA